MNYLQGIQPEVSSLLENRVDRLETLLVCLPRLSPTVDDVLNKMLINSSGKDCKGITLTSPSVGEATKEETNEYYNKEFELPFVPAFPFRVAACGIEEEGKDTTVLDERTKSDRNSDKRSMNDPDGMIGEKKELDCMKQMAGDMSSVSAEKNESDDILEEVDMNGVGEKRNELDDKNGMDELARGDGESPTPEVGTRSAEDELLAQLSPEHLLFYKHFRRAFR